MALHIRCLHPNRLKIYNFRSVAHAVQTEHRTDSRCNTINGTLDSTDCNLRTPFHNPECQQAVVDTKNKDYKWIIPSEKEKQILLSFANTALQELIPFDKNKNKASSVVSEFAHSDIWNDLTFKNVKRLCMPSKDDIIPCDIELQEKKLMDKNCNHHKKKTKLVRPLEKPLKDESSIRYDLKSNIINKEKVDKRDSTSILFKEPLPINDWTLYYCFQNDGITSTDNSKSVKPDPKEDQLEAVAENLRKQMAMFSTSFGFDYKYIHPDIVFVNNFSGKSKIYRGWNSYVRQFVKYKTLCVMRFMYFELRPLDITIRKEESVIQVRWALNTLPQWQVIKFWKYSSSVIRENKRTYDGVSYFHVGSDGKIHKHVLDRMMPDDELKESAAVTIAAKLAALFGLRPSLHNISKCFTQRTPPSRTIGTTVCSTPQ